MALELTHSGDILQRLRLVRSQGICPSEMNLQNCEPIPL